MGCPAGRTRGFKGQAGLNSSRVNVWAGEHGFLLCRPVGFFKVTLGVTGPRKVGEQME